MDGFIVIDKPAGMTSHDVVAFVRRTLRIKKVGHTGTLDPFATGVLPVAVGEGTKAIQFLDESVKEYRATMRLGITTDTDDCTGSTISQVPIEGLDSQIVLNALQSLVGKSMQTPPMYSAIKLNGVPLYKLARKGEEVERQPRPIQIYSITVERIELPDVDFVVRCSRGTYVRTIASDVGKTLGCGAMLTALRRTKSGSFAIESARSPEAFAEAIHGGSEGLAVSIEQALSHLKKVELTAAGFRKAKNGIAPTAQDAASFPAEATNGETVTLNYHGAVIAAGIVSGTADIPKVTVSRGFNQPTGFTDQVLCGNKNHFGSEQTQHNENEAEGGATRCW